MVGRRRMAAAAVAGMPLGCIVRAERWMAGARGLGAVCCTAGLVLEQSWPWRRVLQCLAGRVVGVRTLARTVYFGGWCMRSRWWSESRYLILIPDAA